MKKIFVTLIVLIAISTSIIAKNNPINGKWLLTKVDIKEKTVDVYSEINFKDDGSISMDEVVFGTWEYNFKAKIITIKSTMIKEFAGTRNINKLNKKNMILVSDGDKLYFIKIDEDKVESANKKSGFMGVWEIKGDENITYLSFAKNQKLNIVSKGEGVSSRNSGKWMYDKENNSIIMIIHSHFYKGESIIKSISKNEFVIEKNKEELKAQKINKNAANREILNFTAEDIYNSIDNKPEDAPREEEKLPWKNFDARASYLENVSKIKYKYSTLISDFNVLDTEELTAKVSFDEENNQPVIQSIFTGISADESNDNLFYPVKQPENYRVVTEKQVTVPAGTFKCKVVESYDDVRDTKIRYYMIINRPGVYAKIIVSKKQFDEEQYNMYELTEIDGKFNKQDNKAIIGNWLLVKTKAPDKTKVMSAEFDFINDGRLSVNHAEEGRFFNWNYNKEKNTVKLNLNDKVNVFNIVKLNDDVMELQNASLTYYFTKFNNQLAELYNKKFKFSGYWLLTNTSERYKIMYLSKNDSVFELEYIVKSPLKDNYLLYKGKWLFKPNDSTIIFNAEEQQSQNVGSYKIKKSNKSRLILSNGRDNLVYLKIEPELITKNNKASGLEGLWKVKKSDGNYRYYEFKQPYQFRYSNDNKDEMNDLGLWLYNLDKKELFIGAMIPQLEGFSKIDKISQDTIEFKSGLKAIKVK